MTFIEKVRCPECRTDKPIDEVVCENCILICLDHLKQIPPLHAACEDARNLQGGNGGQGSNSGDISHNRNEAAFEYAVAIELLGMLWAWQELIRDFREMEPRPEPRGTTTRRVELACEFLIVHIQIVRDYPEIAPDFFREIHDHYFDGVKALNDIEEKPRRIECTSNWRGGKCRRRLAINPDEPDAIITCERCRTPWTLRWLEIAHEESGQLAKEWWDAEMIGLYLKITPTHVRRLARELKVPKQIQYPSLILEFHYPTFIQYFKSNRSKGDTTNG